MCDSIQKNTELTYTSIASKQIHDLSGEDRAKIIGLKVAKVAIAIILAAAVVAAVWFLAPIVIPAGIFVFGGVVAGFIGGGALLTAIEAVAFKKLNKIEDKIYDKYLNGLEVIKFNTNFAQPISKYIQENKQEHSLFEDIEREMQNTFSIQIDGEEIKNIGEFKQKMIVEGKWKNKALILSSQRAPAILNGLYEPGSPLEQLHQSKLRECNQKGNFSIRAISLVGGNQNKISHNLSKTTTTIEIYNTAKAQGNENDIIISDEKITCTISWIDDSAQIIVEKINQ